MCLLPAAPPFCLFANETGLFIFRGFPILNISLELYLVLFPHLLSKMIGKKGKFIIEFLIANKKKEILELERHYVATQ